VQRLINVRLDGSRKWEGPGARPGAVSGVVDVGQEDAIVDRTNYIDGAKQALEVEDYETAAKYVETFLQLDAEFDEVPAPEEVADAAPVVKEKELARPAEGEDFKGTAAGTADKAKESAEYAKSVACRCAVDAVGRFGDFGGEPGATERAV
jgi:hypothetical protein